MLLKISVGVPDLYYPIFQDDDPYVRKTAAVSVAKLYQINGPLVEEQGFLDLLWVRINKDSQDWYCLLLERWLFWNHKF